MFTVVSGENKHKQVLSCLSALILNKNNKFLQRRPTETCLLSKGDLKAMNKPGDNSPFRREFTTMYPAWYGHLIQKIS